MNNEKLFNEAAAKYLFGKNNIGIINGVPVVETEEGEFLHKFNPYSDANDRNMVIEKMGLITEIFGKHWQVVSRDYEIAKADKSMEQAQINCITAVLTNLGYLEG